MILMYHHLSAVASADAVKADAFTAQMAWLAEHCNVASLDDHLQALSGSGTLPAVITFDDAYLSFAEIALPILEKHELPATLFVPVGHVGGYNQWDAENGGKKISVMDWEALKELARHPLVTLGVHSWSHKRLSQCTEADLEREIIASRAEMEKKLGIPVKHFAYPYGQLCDMSKTTAKMLRTADYASACTTIWGRNTNPKAHLSLRRLEITPDDELKDFIKKAEQVYHPRLFRQRIKNTLYKLGLRD